MVLIGLEDTNVEGDLKVSVEYWELIEVEHLKQNCHLFRWNMSIASLKLLS